MEDRGATAPARAGPQRGVWDRGQVLGAMSDYW
jgi:hypothetical protein